jgi:hypothetical protein
VYNAINQLWNPNLHVWLDIETEGGSSPAGGPLRNALDDWLVSLDPDEVNATHDPHNMFDLPSFTWERDGWSIRLAQLAAAKAPSQRKTLSGPKWMLFKPGWRHLGVSS